MDVKQRMVWQKVIDRDKGKCLCGRRGSEVHHIIPRSRPFTELWHVKNMIVVCSVCHPKAHNRAARVKYLKYLRRRYKYDYTVAPFREYMEEEGIQSCKVSAKGM